MNKDNEWEGPSEVIKRECSTLHILYNGNVRKVAVCQARKWIEEMSEMNEEAMSEGYASDSSEMSGKEEDYTANDVINEAEERENVDPDEAEEEIM